MIKIKININIKIYDLEENCERVVPIPPTVHVFGNGVGRDQDRIKKDSDLERERGKRAREGRRDRVGRKKEAKR